MASSTSTIRPFTDVVTISNASPTKVYTVKEGSFNLPYSVAVLVPTGAAHTVYVCNSDDVDLTRGFPLTIGTPISMDLQAGDVLWLIADTAPVAVRILVTGAQ